MHVTDIIVNEKKLTEKVWQRVISRVLKPEGVCMLLSWKFDRREDSWERNRAEGCFEIPAEWFHSRWACFSTVPFLCLVIHRLQSADCVQCACWWMCVLIYTYSGSKVMAVWYVQPAENTLKGRKHGYRCVDGDRVLWSEFLEHGMLWKVERWIWSYTRVKKGDWHLYTVHCVGKKIRVLGVFGSLLENCLYKFSNMTNW